MLKFYDFFGEEKTKSLFSSQEKRSDNKYILYPYNSFSSIFFIISGILLLKEIDKLQLLFGIILILIGFFSFFWWASRRYLFHKYDIVLTGLLIFSIPIIFLYKENKIEFNLLVLLMGLYSIFLYYLYTYRKFDIIKLFKILTGFISFIFLSKKNFNLLILFCLAIFFKMNDTYQCINLDFNLYGTAIFHILCSLAYYNLITNNVKFSN